MIRCKDSKIPVLMYHALEDEQHPAGAKDQGEQLYIVSVDNFREQMWYIYSNGFKTYLLNELNALDTWPHKAVVLTFDDGHESNFTLALPILKEFGFKAEFFITTGWIGTKHFLKSNQIVALHKAGMAIGSHSVSHPYFDDLSNVSINKELSESSITLSEIIGKKIEGFSAPGGRLTQSTVEAAKKYDYHFLCTSIPKALNKNTVPFKIPRFAVRQNTFINEFGGIINLNSALLSKIRIRSFLLNYTKKLLGNKLYENMREALM